MSLIKQIYYVILFLAFFLSMLERNRTDKVLKIFPFLLGLAILTQIIEDYFHITGHRHIFIFHIYDGLEYISYSIYFHLLFESVRVTRIIIFSGVLYFLFLILYFTFYKDFWNDSFGLEVAVKSLFIVGFTVYFYYNLIQKDISVDLFRYPHFYINTANIAHFSLTLCAMSLNDFFQSISVGMAEIILDINRYSNLYLYILYCVAFLCYRIRIK
jgi:hypothetical protein